MKKCFAKLTALCLAAAVAFGAAGCGKEKKETQQDKNAVAADDTKEDKTVELSEGAGFAQGNFFPFGITEDDDCSEQRNGGFGSTDSKRG